MPKVKARIIALDEEQKYLVLEIDQSRYPKATIQKAIDEDAPVVLDFPEEN